MAQLQEELAAARRTIAAVTKERDELSLRIDRDAPIVNAHHEVASLFLFSLCDSICYASQLLYLLSILLHHSFVIFHIYYDFESGC